MADIDLQIIAAHQTTPHPRQTTQRSPVPRVAPDTGALPRHDSPAYTTTTTVSFDVLLAAQQARTPEKIRAFDVRGAYGEKSPADRLQTGRREDARPQTAVFVDQAPQQTPPSEAPPIETPPSETPGADNVIPLFAGPQFTEQREFTAPQEETAAVRPQGGDINAANRAYVNAGAFDGRTYASAGLEGRLRSNTQGFDLLV